MLRKLIKSIGCTIQGTAPNEFLQIEISNQELGNLCVYDLVLCQNKPVGAEDLPVKIKDGGVIIPCLCRSGNILHANMINKRIKYTFVYGNDSDHVLFLTPLCEKRCECDE